MEIIKCNICKLDEKTCNQKCIEIDDVSELYIEDAAKRDAILKRFCTAHNCPYNLNGFTCKLDKCCLR